MCYVNKISRETSLLCYSYSVYTCSSCFTDVSHIRILIVSTSLSSLLINNLYAAFRSTPLTTNAMAVAVCAARYSMAICEEINVA